MNEVIPTGGLGRSIICLPEIAVDDSGIDIDLSNDGIYKNKKENSAKDGYYFLLYNLGAVDVFIAFDSEASNIDTTDTDNSDQTYNLILKANGDRLDSRLLSLKAETISLITKTAESSTVYAEIK